MMQKQAHYIRSECKQTGFKEWDTVIYQVLQSFIETVPLVKRLRTEQQLLLFMKCWYYSAIRLHESILGETRDTHIKDLEQFYQLFRKHTSHYDTYHRTEILYRFPWHMGNLLYQTKENRFPFSYVADMSELQQPVDLFYACSVERSMTTSDVCALLFLEQQKGSKNERLCDMHVKYNLPLIIHSLEHGFPKKNMRTQDSHTYQMINSLYTIVRKEKKDKKYFAFPEIMVTMFMICYWHFETKEVQRTWFDAQTHISVSVM